MGSAHTLLGWKKKGRDEKYMNNRISEKLTPEDVSVMRPRCSRLTCSWITELGSRAVKVKKPTIKLYHSFLNQVLLSNCHPSPLPYV